jgi:hypothetical protein
MTSEPAEQLAEFFNADPDYFMAYDRSNMKELTDVLEKHRKLLDAPEQKRLTGPYIWL